MDENGSICTGRTSCASFGVIICLFFSAIFFNYISRCIHSSRPSPPPPPSLPLFATATTTITATATSPAYRDALKSIPETNYERNSRSNRNNFESENCAVCLAAFEEREKVRVLPKCKHVYHKECIDKWLIRSLHCPVCRERVVDPHHALLHAKLISTPTLLHDHHREDNTNHPHFSPAYLLF